MSLVRSSPALTRAAAPLLLLLVSLLRVPAPATAAPPELITCELTLSPVILDPREIAVGAIGGINLFISPFDLADQRPPSITKENAYVGRPRYGAVTVGNGPRRVTYFAIDEAPGFAGKIYVDLNQNGDLTDDGTGDWETVKVDDQGRNCMKTIAVHASWGTPLEEKESGSYTLWLTKRDGNARGGALIRMSGRVGMLTLAGKAYPIVLGENTADGIFTVPADGDLTRAPVTLYIDTENNEPFDAHPPATRPATNPTQKRVPQKFNIAHPFPIDGRWYMARPSISGATLTVQETTAPDLAAQPPVIEADKVPVGAMAPDFTVEGPDGKPLRLADFRGKLVILDLWATWCGPCQQSMPGLEKLYQRIKDQDVVVLSVNVQDEKKLFDAWMAKHAEKDYHFTFGFDPKGDGDGSLISKYGVPAIPVWFLITRDGKIAAKKFGYDGTENELVRALREQKVRIEGE